MPPPLNPQTIVAFIWDFDKTLTHGYMQEPLFAHFGVDAPTFWAEVDALTAHYEQRDLRVSKDSAYLGHMLSYARPEQPFAGLTNELLRSLGGQVPLAPGMPDFIGRTREEVAGNQRFMQHGITVEHYVVSTGLRQMIEGNAIREHLDGVWACELLSDPPGANYANGRQDGETGVLTQVGYTIDNTTKTRAIFEINKGSNVDAVDVNARMAEDDRRVPIRNMIYVADGPSDVPVFSIVQAGGGRTLGVFTPDGKNYEGVKALQDGGRINHYARADYTPNSDADMWLMTTLKQIAGAICDRRDRGLQQMSAPAGHITT